VTSTLTGWQDVPQTSAQIAAGSSSLSATASANLWNVMRSVLDRLDNVINFDDFDSDGDRYIGNHSKHTCIWQATSPCARAHWPTHPQPGH
jgi:hypothetical protein